MSNIKINRRALYLHILLGTLYGAVWAVTLLVLSARWQDGPVLVPAWVQLLASRMIMGLWFGAVGGALAGLINGLARYKIDIDREPWSAVIILLGGSIGVVGGVIGVFFSAIQVVLQWLERNPALAIRIGNDTSVPAISIGLLLVLPATLALWMITTSHKKAFS